MCVCVCAFIVIHRELYFLFLRTIYDDDDIRVRKTFWWFEIARKSEPRELQCVMLRLCQEGGSIPGKEEEKLPFDRCFIKNFLGKGQPRYLDRLFFDKK